MAWQVSRRCALTIAGSDSGGGAGIQADLKTFASIGVHGTSVITCITAQNPMGVLGVQASTPAIVGLQLRAVLESFRPAAGKTGMLYSRPLIDEVARWMEHAHFPPLIVDPVMIATRGARLLKPSAIDALKRRILPNALLATPNLDEAVVLTGMEICCLEHLRAAARCLRDLYGCAALVKGGHLEGPEAVDVYWDGREERVLAAPRVAGVSTHGTGCTYSAAIAGYIAQGCPLGEAVWRGKEFVTRAIRGTIRVNGREVLGHGNGG
ncbi:MAG: bifunctional hydroxymethylpyrimidine kinase/phosphomethylpyrimidine kinase [Limisphaerales bacterium]